MDLTILELYILSLLDRGLVSKYELQRRGGVSLGSSSPALKRLLSAGLITGEDAKDGSKRARQILKLTSAGCRTIRQGWRQHFHMEADLDVEAIVRLVDIATYRGASRTEIVAFLKAAVLRRSLHVARGHHSIADGIVDLQEQLLAYRAEAESIFLKELAKSFNKSRKSATNTNGRRTKIKRSR